MSRAIPLLSLCACMARYRVNFNYVINLVLNIPSFPNSKYDEWNPLTRFKDSDVATLRGESVLLLQTNLIVRK